jgi:hypothetical protein
MEDELPTLADEEQIARLAHLGTGRVRSAGQNRILVTCGTLFITTSPGRWDR